MCVPIVDCERLDTPYVHAAGTSLSAINVLYKLPNGVILSAWPVAARSCLRAVQYAFIKLGIIRPERKKMAILNNVSSVLRPGRTTLLLGPPAAGKSTLLKALAGKLSHTGLKVRIQQGGWVQSPG